MKIKSKKIRNILASAKAFILNFKEIELAVAAALLVSAILSVSGFYSECKEIRSQVLRLHVIADSDSDYDQNIKLKVRDAVLNEGKEIFDGSVTADEAKEKIEPQKERLILAAKKVLEENGSDDNVTISVTEEFFDTRCYENFTMPAGRYNAVKVIIGSGEGKNWWCVMFPPLCLGAVSQESAVDACFSVNGTKIVESSPKYEPRFKIVEIIEKIKNKF